VNLMKKQNEPSNDYTIFLSGKGNHYLDIQQEINGEMINQSYLFNITVLPSKPYEGEKVTEPETDTVEIQDKSLPGNDEFNSLTAEAADHLNK
jgi:hypothetical protein